MKKFLITIFILIISILAVLFINNKNSQKKLSSSNTFQDRQIIQVNLADKELSLEVVNTPASITLGLSGREEIGADGMLFILPTGYTHPSFWMKEMRFDLDMIWLENFIVVDVNENVPAPDMSTPLNELPSYSPQTGANMVLEVNAGQFESLGVKIGDKLTIIE